MAKLNYMDDSPSRTKPIRTRLRFTLRLLLAVVTVLCICLAVWTHRAREQRRLVGRISTSGGKVKYDSELSIPTLFITWLGDDYFRDIVEAEICDAALLSELPRLHMLECLHINSHQVTDDDFAPVARLRRLKGIDIYGDYEDPNTQIGDRSLALLAELPVLELVNLESSRVTAINLTLLTRSKSLGKLYVASPDESIDESAAEPFRQCMSYLCIRQSVPGGFGKIVASWYLSSPPGPRSSTTDN